MTTNKELHLLGSTAQLRPWRPPQSSSIKKADFLGGFSTIFYRVGLLAPRQTPTLEDVYIPQRQGGPVIPPRTGYPF
jgi:hypothetical protein